MSFLTNNTEYLSARLTNKGRKKISEGDFNIKYFQIGDSEFDYNFSMLDGTSEYIPSQRVFSPLDMDVAVKYPYKLSDSSISGTTFGTPILGSEVLTIKNEVGAAGFVSAYEPYIESPLSGSSIICDEYTINISSLNGTNILQVPSSVIFTGTEYITIYFGELVGTNNIIPINKNSQVYKIISLTQEVGYNTIELDRPTPDLSTLSGNVTIMSNYCDPNYIEPGTSVECMPLPIDISEQQDPWKLNVVWGEKPAGVLNHELSGYTSNIYTSTKEYLGYNLSDGQISNSGTTINNDCGETIILPPEEQHSLAILHYQGVGNYRDPDRYFKYEDFIVYDVDGTEYFEIYIPFILYHRNTSDTIGAVFHMDNTDYYINSSAMDTKTNKIKFRYLLDEQDIRVGKVFVHHRTIVFDDQEIITALDNKTNRKYTLPTPKINQLPLGINCTPTSSTEGVLLDSTETIYVSYLFETSTNQYINGMHCNNYIKTTGTDIQSNIGVSFCDDGFKFMYDTLEDYKNGFIADKFKIIAQIVPTGQQPEPDSWVVMDFTDDITDHVSGDLINSDNIKNSLFIITKDRYDNGLEYNINDYLGNVEYFGAEQPFPGSIKLIRGSDIYTMNFKINLPEGQFEITQNPTWESEKTKKITEVALLNSNKDTMVVGKTSTPLTRVGTQVIQVMLDF